MIVLAFLLGYPAFMVFAYGLSKVLFTPLDKVESEHKREMALLLQRSRRNKKVRPKTRWVSNPQPTPVFDLPELNPQIVNRVA
jgi:hypothetical protein